jgi:hypothetical protein
MDDVLANFENPTDQWPCAFVEQMVADHPDADRDQLATDAILAVGEFHEALFGEQDGESRDRGSHPCPSPCDPELIRASEGVKLHQLARSSRCIHPRRARYFARCVTQGRAALR